jgi:hypothetical protein
MKLNVASIDGNLERFFSIPSAGMGLFSSSCVTEYIWDDGTNFTGMFCFAFTSAVYTYTHLIEFLSYYGTLVGIEGVSLLAYSYFQVPSCEIDHDRSTRAAVLA